MSSCRASGREDTLLSGLPDSPNQPMTFSFPVRDYGKKTVVKRSFQASWFSSWKWLHYNEAEDCVHCHLCLTAVKQKLVNLTPGDDSAFVSFFVFFCSHIS